jgi:hypothetical protein
VTFIRTSTRRALSALRCDLAQFLTEKKSATFNHSGGDKQ